MKEYIISFLILFILGFLFFSGINYYKSFSEIDFCLDTGICVENLELNTEIGKIIINKENCLKYNWEWNEEKRFCKLSD